MSDAVMFSDVLQSNDGDEKKRQHGSKQASVCLHEFT